MVEFFLFYRGGSSGLLPRLWPSAFGRASVGFRRGSGGGSSDQIPILTWFLKVVPAWQGFLTLLTLLVPQVMGPFPSAWGGEVFRRFGFL